jgi:uncharacterized membrane protein
MDGTTLLPLIGIPIVVIIALQPAAGGRGSGAGDGFAGRYGFRHAAETFGEKFVNSRSLATFILILPVIGLLEYYGLKELAQAWWRRSLVPLRRVF